MDSPVGQLKKHTAPVPYLGGLAIYFSFLLGILGVLILAQPSDRPGPWLSSPGGPWWP